MSRLAWRIATDTPDYEADDLTGEGARRTGGRWNPPGAPLIYASESRALACLETSVHLNAGGLPLNRFLVRLELPEAAWAAAESVAADTLVGWDAEPPGRASVAFGARWAREKRSLLLFAPSVVVPEERNLLINPLHPALGAVISTKVRRWTYDPRLARRD